MISKIPDSNWWENSAFMSFAIDDASEAASEASKASDWNELALDEIWWSYFWPQVNRAGPNSYYLPFFA